MAAAEMALTELSPTVPRAKPDLSFGRIIHLCFGFFGLQFGFALQNANVSRIFQTLGASVDAIPVLWIAAPFSGLLLQPIVGYCSDRTWSRWGRRRPYFLVGALFASAALIAMPRSVGLWMAAVLLWILDASLNLSMEPFRALVGDQLNASQRPTGFAMQGFFIGLGAVIASALPYLLARAGVSNEAHAGSGAAAIPDTVRVSFDVGGLVLLAAVAWTGWRTREYAPADLRAFSRQSLAAAAGGQTTGALGTFIDDLLHMPSAMRRLVPVQFFSWLALFAMWIYTTAAVSARFFGSSDPRTLAFNEGANWVGILFAAYNGFAALAAAVIPVMVRRLGLRLSHLLNLILGGLGLLSFLWIRDPHWLLVSMLGVGFAWASILSLPYALLSNSVPAEKMGVYMGIFNVFVVIPQLVAAGMLGRILEVFFHAAPLYALAIGGACFLVAGLFALRVNPTES